MKTMQYFIVALVIASYCCNAALNKEIYEYEDNGEILIKESVVVSASCVAKIDANDYVYSREVKRRNDSLASIQDLEHVFRNVDKKARENMKTLLRYDDAMFVVLGICRRFRDRMSNISAVNMIERLPKSSIEEAKEITRHENQYGEEALIKLGIKCRNYSSGGIKVTPVCPTVSISLFKYFIRGGALVNPKYDSGPNALYSAVMLNKLDIVRYLVQHTDVRVNDVGDKVSLPLILALMKGYCDIVKYLMTEAKAQYGTFVFMAAVKSCNECIINFLLSYKHVGNIDRYEFPYGSDYTLYHGSKCGSLDFVKLLVNFGFDVNARDSFWDDETALHVAAKNGSFPMVTYLIINASANASIKNKHGNTALVEAARGGFLDITKYLVNLAIAENDQDSISRALIDAAHHNHLDIVRYLVAEAHAGLVIKTRYGNYSVLHAAAKYSRINIFKYLVGDLDIRNINGESALHIAANYNDLNIVKYLVLELGLDVRARNTKGKTPLQVAIKSKPKPTKVIQWLQIKRN